MEVLITDDGRRIPIPPEIETADAETKEAWALAHASPTTAPPAPADDEEE